MVFWDWGLVFGDQGLGFGFWGFRVWGLDPSVLSHAAAAWQELFESEEGAPPHGSAV